LSKCRRDEATSCSPVPGHKTTRTHQTPIAYAPAHPSIPQDAGLGHAWVQAGSYDIPPACNSGQTNSSSSWSWQKPSAVWTGTGHPRKLLVKGNKCFSEQQAREERQRAVQETSLIAIQLALNDSRPPRLLQKDPITNIFFLTIEIFGIFCCPGTGRRGAGCLCTLLSTPCAQGPDWLQGTWLSVQRAELRLCRYQTPRARFGSGQGMADPPPRTASPEPDLMWL